MKFMSKEHKHMIYRQAIAEGNETAEKISEWLTANGYPKQTAASVRQYLRQVVGKHVKRSKRPKKGDGIYYYRLA